MANEGSVALSENYAVRFESGAASLWLALLQSYQEDTRVVFDQDRNNTANRSVIVRDFDPLRQCIVIITSKITVVTIYVKIRI